MVVNIDVAPVGMNSLFIDISDLLIYAIGNRRMSGIQRVELSFLQSMIEHDFKYTLVNAFGIDSSEVDFIIRAHIGSPDSLLSELASLCAKLERRKVVYTLKDMGWRLAGRLIGRSWDGLPQLSAGDTLFVPGAFWLDSHIMRFYRLMAEKGVKLVVFLHDVMPITHPDLMIEGSDRFFGQILTLPIHVITSSRSTQRDLPRAASLVSGGQTPLSVEVVPLAHEFPGVVRNQPPGDQTERLQPMIRGRTFVLYVSTVEVRKNHLRLIEVWNKLAQDLGAALPVLVIAGKRGWEAEAAITRLDAANERELAQGGEPVLFLEAPSDAELRWLYASCDFTVFASLAEGWGLPVGESLWFGKTCAASNTTSLPEVGQNLCIYFDPLQPDEIEAAIKTLLDPAVRAVYEAKIRAAALRRWHDAGRDLALAVTARAGGI